MAATKALVFLVFILSSCSALLHIQNFKSFVKTIRNKMVSIDWQQMPNTDSEDGMTYAHDEVTCK